MITKEALKLTEYTPYVNPVLRESNPHYRMSFQKPVWTIIDPPKLKFFVNIDSYDLTEIEEVNKDFVLSCNAQFYKGEEVFNVEYLVNDNTTIAQIETLFTEIFDKVGCSFKEVKA